MSIEKIVRPAQTPAVGPATGPKKIRSRSAWQTIVRRFGDSGGSLKTMSGSYSYTFNYYTVKKPKEKTNAGLGSFP
jgi:hypothetical protein